MEVVFNQGWLTQSRDDQLRRAELSGIIESATRMQKKANARFLLAFWFVAICFILCLAAVYERRLLADNLTVVVILDAFLFGGAMRFLLNARYRLEDAARKREDALHELQRLEGEVSAMQPIFDDIRRVLMKVWDPIGVSDEPYAQDEYDRYIPYIYDLLEWSDPDSEIENFLNWVATERMGFVPNQIQTTKEAIVALKLIPFNRNRQ